LEVLWDARIRLSYWHQWLFGSRIRQPNAIRVSETLIYQRVDSGKHVPGIANAEVAHVQRTELFSDPAKRARSALFPP
jgi:hypothetical protein